jgi:hypothetical protein
MEASERHQVFEEDVVCLGDDDTELGIVTELGWTPHDDDGEGNHYYHHSLYAMCTHLTCDPVTMRR